MFGAWRRRRQIEAMAAACYARAVEQARQPVLYTGFGVPDSLDGRFELVLLHVFLLLRRLKAADAAGRALGQALYDFMFADFDRSLREIGVGDVGVPKHIKRMATGFGGRIDAYDTGLAAGGEAMAAALRRNVFGTCPTVAAELPAALATYAAAAGDWLTGQDDAAVLAGQFSFPDPAVYVPSGFAPSGRAMAPGAAATGGAVASS